MERGLQQLVMRKKKIGHIKETYTGEEERIEEVEGQSGKSKRRAREEEAVPGGGGGRGTGEESEL